MTDFPQPASHPLATAASPNADSNNPNNQMVRSLSWHGAFWVAAGVPPLVLFAIGGIAGVAGKVAFLVWIVSMTI